MKILKSNQLCKLGFICLILSVFFFSCKKDDVPQFTPPLNDNSLPSAAVYNVKVLEKSGKKLRFSIDLAVFKDSKNMEYNFNNQHFKIDTIPGVFGFKIARSALSSTGTQSTYSALMLMDQSGSIANTDPDDYRIDAAKIFCWNMGTGNNAWLWWFSNGYKAVGSNFATDTAQLVKDVESVKDLGGGGTDLYKSQYASIDGAAKNGDKSVKALLSFTDGEDNGGGYTPEQVSAFANTKKVRMYNIGLGDAETPVLLKQAAATGGAFMYAKDAKQLISMFGNLGKLLDNSARFYTIEWEAASLKSSDLTTGTINTTLKIETPYNYTIDVPIVVAY